MPIDASPSGTLDIENATLRSREIVALTNMVAGNDVVRSLNPPTLEIYGDPEPTLELVSNVNDVSASAFARLTSNAGVFSIQSGVNQEIDSKGDIAFTSINGNSEHMRIVGSTGRIGIGTTNPTSNLHVMGDINLEHVSNVATLKVNSNVVAEYTGPHDRPLRKYPEVAMTSASQGGYVVTPSTQNATHVAYHMFDGDRSTRWAARGTTDSYDSSSPYLYNGSNSSSISDTSGTPHDGAFLKLELPKAIKLDYTIIRENTDPASRTPGKITFLGSTNGTDWTFLKEFSGMSNTALDETYIINDTNYYNHFAFVVKNLSDGDGVLDLGEWELYGYEEGSGSIDTTLKSVYNVPATTGTQLEVYYDGRETSSYSGSGTTVTDLALPANNGTLNGGVGFDSTYKAFTFNSSSNQYISLTSPMSGNYVHTMSMWFKPTGLTATSGDGILFVGDNTDNNKIEVFIESGRINYTFRANDYQVYTEFLNNVWYHLTLTYNGQAGQNGREIYLNGKKLQGTHSGNSAVLNISNNALDIGRYTPSGTSTAYAFDGSIANFRLYSKVLNADQVKELYDYQKDYFLGSKSQVTLYKGHLGVGVTEPSGQLELAGDERLQEYPPRGMTNHSTYIEGHGVFKASASSQYSNSFEPWGAFSDTSDYDLDIWVSDNNEWYTSNGYPSVLHYLADNTPGGAWIKIEMPYKIKLNSFSFVTGTRNYSTETFPENFQIWASNGTEWNHIYSVSGFGNPPNETGGTTWGHTNVNSQTHYSMYAMVITKLYMVGANTRAFVSIPRWKLFGTPGPTTLDKGSLSLTRSLDVPRVSRYDVDTETPRPEKLVVDFDTTVNSSPTDISGKGNHGTFYGNAKYSAADKAFVFDGTDDVIYNTGIGNWSDNISHTFSWWFKCESVGAGNYGGGLVTLYNTVSTVNHYSAFSFETGSSGQINFYHFGNDISYNYPFELNRWYHVAGVYSGSSTTQKVYVDGVDLGPGTVAPGSVTTALILGTSPKLSLGGDYGRSDFYFDGQISNFKIYNVALEPSEVKKLYNLGRTGRSMVISDTAVGIGKVPEAQLDVRGTISATSDIQVYSPDGISKIRTGKVGMFFQNSGRNIDPDTQFSPTRTYSIWESNVGGEGSYIAINGDNIVMSSPCDDESLRYYDEDDGNEVWNISNAGALVVGSDSRRKHDIKPVIWENVLKKIGNIEPSTFKFKQPESYTRVTSKWDKEHIGFIAQNVQENFPELVTEDGSSENYLLVNSSMMILPIIQGIQQLTNELEAQKAKNESLETQVSDLLARVTALENA